MKSKEIKGIRTKLDMIQTEFAKELGVVPITISQWETGIRKPSKLAIKAIEMLYLLKTMKKGFKEEVEELFDKINKECFNNEIKRKYTIEISKRMKGVCCLGRFFSKDKIIKVSIYFKNRPVEELEDTLKHEMVHAWLYEKKKPYGHTREFKTKLLSIT